MITILEHGFHAYGIAIRGDHKFGEIHFLHVIAFRKHFCHLSSILNAHRFGDHRLFYLCIISEFFNAACAPKWGLFLIPFAEYYRITCDGPFYICPAGFTGSAFGSRDGEDAGNVGHGIVALICCASRSDEICSKVLTCFTAEGIADVAFIVPFGKCRNGGCQIRILFAVALGNIIRGDRHCSRLDRQGR